MITASKLELAMRCPSAFTLPQYNTPTAAADEGTARHAKQEAAIARGDIPAELERAWPGYSWRAEVAFAYDVSTGEGREIGQGIGREYGPLGPFEVAGTADVIGRKGSALVVVDKKSYGEVTAAADNPQVRFLALAAARAYGASCADVGITHELNALDWAELDAFELDVIALAVRATVVAVAKAMHDARQGITPTFTTGRQCRWCAGFDACPKQRELAELVRTDALSLRVEAGGLPLVNDDDAAAAYALSKRLGMLLARMKEMLAARAKDRPIPLPGGMLYGYVTGEGNEQIDGDVAYEVIRDVYGQSVADAAVSREATKKGIREALKAAGAVPSLAAAERNVLDKIRERGGAERQTRSKLDVYPAQPALRVVNS